MPFSAFIFAALVGGQSAPSAEDLVRKCFARRGGANFEAVLEQMSPRGNGYVRLRLWRDANGRRRTEVLSPLEMQGQVSVDDGTTWTTFFPDARRVRSHPSPMLQPDDMEARMRLLRRNYRLEIDEKSVVAGRTALRVVARPVAADLDTRRFYVDAATYVPLKAESVNDLGGVTVQFAVRRIDFPARFDKELFELEVPEGAKRVASNPPAPLKNVSEAQRRLGFRPVSPMRLPMGFRPLGMEAIEWKGMKRVAIRLSDGLVPIFVYQFRPSDNPTPASRPNDDKTFRDVGDLRVEVRGDVPVSIRERILAAYVRAIEALRASPAKS